MAKDLVKEKQFEMSLMEIYKKHSWLQYELSEGAFIALFPVHYKKGALQRLDKPIGFDVDRDIYLEVLVAFRNTFL